jgi:aspartyl-tRNA synthetase
MYRTHNCNELRKEDTGKEVTLAGWVHSVRTHGPLSFIDLRDRYGRTQITLQDVKNLPGKEAVIQVTGKVTQKDEANKALATGDIEVKATTYTLINPAKPLPLDENATEETRLKYRYLDIRNNNVLANLAFRSEVVSAAREFFHSEGFLEIETPLLVKSTPEGARDYVVPSRVNKHEFYALPQSPQLYKQILMVAGVDKYYQVARCLRDEDLRADRQPEHTQMDFEMSFVHQEDVHQFVEGLMKHVFKSTMQVELNAFPVFSYEEAMRRFGSDKPDIRFGLELTNVTSIVQDLDFKVFSEAEMVNCIYVGEDYSRKQIDAYTELVKTYQAKGLAFVKVANGSFESGVAKFLPETVQKQILEAINVSGDGTIFFVADNKKISQTALGHLRNQLAKDLEIIDSKEFKFCWVNDFPLFSYNEDEKKWEPEHHMFSMPKNEFIDDFEKRPAEVKGDLWDLVLNGWEMASGSIRISNPELQERILNFVGFDKKEAQEKFGFLLTAYDYGGPIHGGMGIGLDRLVAMMKGLTDIRQVIAFPKNKSAQCPMDDSPGKIAKEQLEELHIALK